MIFWPHIYSRRHDPRSFAPYASELWPGRWLLASGDLSSSRGVSASASEFRHNEAGLLSFSAGPLNCIGKALALLELRMVVCAFFKRFTVRMQEGWDPKSYEMEYRDYFTSSRPNLPITLEVR